jgi:DNA-binding Xre family transcriptional regulator
VRLALRSIRQSVEICVELGVGDLGEFAAIERVPIRVWREYRGLSLRALAEKAGISAAMLSEIKNGKKEGSVCTLAALARALRLDLDDLVPWS